MTMFELQAQDVTQTAGKWRIGLSGGGGYSLASTKDAAKTFEELGVDYQKAKDGMNQLKWQLQGGADVHYLVKPTWGLGLKYLFTQFDGKIEDVVLNMNGDGISMTSGNIRSQYYMNYVGPSFFMRSFVGPDSKFALTNMISIGYSHLRLEQLTLYSPVVGTGSSVGLYVALGAEYYFTKRLALGCDFGLFGSSFSKVNYDNGYNTWKVDFGDTPENVSNLNLSFHFRLYL